MDIFGKGRMMGKLISKNKIAKDMEDKFTKSTILNSKGTNSSNTLKTNITNTTITKPNTGFVSSGNINTINDSNSYSFYSYEPEYKTLNTQFVQNKLKEESTPSTKRINFAEYPIEEQGNMLNKLKQAGRLSQEEYDEDLGKILRQYNDNTNNAMYYDLYEDEFDEDKKIKTIPRQINDGYENENKYPPIKKKSTQNNFAIKNNRRFYQNQKSNINKNEIKDYSNWLDNQINNANENAYGFDSEVLEIMNKLKNNIKKQNPTFTNEEVEYEYLNILGSFVYRDNIFKTSIWNITAGNPEKGKEGLNNDLSLSNYYGLTDEEESILSYNIRLQNQMSGADGEMGYYDQLFIQTGEDTDTSTYQDIYEEAYGLDRLAEDEFKLIWDNYIDKYSNTADFAHQAITTATMLSTDTDNKHPIANFFNDDYREDLAGWRGDATIGSNPTLGDDDYMADLDAENIMYIARRDNIDVSQAAYRYAAIIENGTTRAEFFISHTDIEKIKHTIFKSSGLYNDSKFLTHNISAMDRLREISPDAYNFILNLENKNHEMINYIK